jgi:hypothetical protein
VKDMLINVTNRSWVAILLGLGALIVAGYFKFKASGDNAVRPEKELATVSGEVASVSEVELTTTRSRGGSSKERYYEIEVKPKGGTVVQLHMPITTKRAMLESIIEEPVQAKYDPDDGNNIYELTMDGQVLQSYAQTSATLKAAAASSAKVLAQPLVFVAGGGALLIGILGFLWNRKLKTA